MHGMSQTDTGSMVTKLSHVQKNQREYEHALKDHQKVYIVCSGPAGTGKTLLAVREGLRRLQRGSIEKIIFTRPAR